MNNSNINNSATDQNKRLYFTGSTEKNAISYMPGEEMVFRLHLTENGTPVGFPKYRWQIAGDDGKSSEGISNTTGGEAVVRTSVSCPGFAHVIVTACDRDGAPIAGADKFEGGAGVEIAKLRQGVGDPGDFDDFWKEQLLELDKTEPAIIEKVQVQSPSPLHDVFDMKLHAPGKMPVSGYLSMPKGATAGSLDAHLTYMGYGSVSGASIGTEKNTILFAVNRHGFENGRDQEYYARMSETVKGFGFNNDENTRPETVYFRHMILRDLQAVRFVKTMLEWNGKNLHISGGSMGAFQSVSVTALERDVTKLTISVPWLCDLGGIMAGRLKGWRPEFAEGLRYYDTVAHASRVRCPAAITAAGLGDYTCPPSGVSVLYNNLKGSKSIAFHQNRRHGYTPPEYAEYTV